MVLVWSHEKVAFYYIGVSFIVHPAETSRLEWLLENVHYLKLVQDSNILRKSPSKVCQPFFFFFFCGRRAKRLATPKEGEKYCNIIIVQPCARLKRDTTDKCVKQN